MVTAMYDENNIQALAAIKHLTRHEIRLLPMDEITAIEPTETGIEVFITRYQWVDRKREIRVTGRGIVIISIDEQTIGMQRWKITDKTVVWDAEQCGEEMAHAIRAADMERAQHWMRMQMLLEKMGDFTPFDIPHYGTFQSASEWADRVKRERMAGRVGTSGAPMDTYERTQAGYTTDRMASHWKRG